MNLDTIIRQLIVSAPIFNGNVAGSADYAVGLETTVNLPMPCAFVYPLEDVIEESQGMGGSLRQQVTERIAVVVIVSNQADRRGQAAVDTIESLKYDIFAGLLNFNVSGIPRTAHGLWYGGGHLLGFDRARLFWEFQFYAVATIDETDGFYPTAEYLDQINIYDTAHNSLEIEIDLAVLLTTETGTPITTEYGYNVTIS